MLQNWLCCQANKADPQRELHHTSEDSAETLTEHFDSDTWLQHYREYTASRIDIYCVRPDDTVLHTVCNVLDTDSTVSEELDWRCDISLFVDAQTTYGIWALPTKEARACCYICCTNSAMESVMH